MISRRGGGEREGGELLTCPYPLKVQVYPPRDHIPALRSKVSGQEEHIGGGGGGGEGANYLHAHIH